MKQTWLIPLDGSEIALRPVAWVLENAANLKEAPHIHLLNVQPALPGDISRFINADTVRDFHLDSGMAALQAAHTQLLAAGLTAERHVLVGEAAPCIIEFATTHNCQQILMGTRGHSGFTGTLFGSIAMRVSHLATVPVLLVR